MWSCICLQYFKYAIADILYSRELLELKISYTSETYWRSLIDREIIGTTSVCCKKNESYVCIFSAEIKSDDLCMKYKLFRSVFHFSTTSHGEKTFRK